MTYKIPPHIQDLTEEGALIQEALNTLRNRWKFVFDEEQVLKDKLRIVDSELSQWFKLH